MSKHGSPELDEDARKLEALGADPGPTLDDIFAEAEDVVLHSARVGPPELVSIEGDDIVIRVSPEALTHATEHGVLCTFIPRTGNFRAAQITDASKWRDAVLRALRREQENGDTPVHLMLDAALEHALEQGEEGVWVEGITDDP